MKYITIFSFVVLSIGLSSCEKKDRITTVQGKVIDFGNGEPVQGITVRMTDGIKLSDNFFGDQYGDFSGEVAETTTNDKGEFTISIEGKNPAAVAPVDPDFSDYWNYDLGETAVSNSFDGYDNGSTNEGEIFRMKAKAYCSINFISSTGQRDSVDFGLINADGSDNIFFLDKQPRESDHVDFLNRAIFGNKMFRYKLKYKRNGTWNALIDSIYVTKGDTITDVIYY